MIQSFNFEITHKDKPGELFHMLSIEAESQKEANEKAQVELDFFSQSMEIMPTEFLDFVHIVPKINYPENFIASKDKAGFAWFPIHFDSAYKDLADIAETEDWEYHSTPIEYERPILVNYIKYTYKRLAQENKIAISEDGRFSCFNTGLVTDNQEPIYATFEANRKKDLAPWVFKGWLRQGDRKLTVFSELPDIARFFDDPACLFFDSRKKVSINLQHIIKDIRDRFPEPYKSQNDYALQTTIKGSIDNTKERVRRSYRMAIPCYYSDKIQLLLPLCLKDPKHADLALAVENYEDFYRVTTCLTLSMAYCDARLIAKPDREWLIP